MTIKSWLCGLLGVSRKKVEAPVQPTLSEADAAKAKIEQVVGQIWKTTIRQDAGYLLNDRLFSELPGVERTVKNRGEEPPDELKLGRWHKVERYVGYRFQGRKIEMAAVGMQSWESDTDESGWFYLWADGELVFHTSCNRGVINEANDRGFYVTLSPDSLEVFRRGKWIDDLSELVAQSKQNEVRMTKKWAEEAELREIERANRLDSL